MKLQKQLSKKYGDRSYHRYVIVIPSKIVEKAELKEGDELDVIDATKHHILLKKRL